MNLQEWAKQSAEATKPSLKRDRELALLYQKTYLNLRIFTKKIGTEEQVKELDKTYQETAEKLNIL